MVSCRIRFCMGRGLSACLVAALVVIAPPVATTTVAAAFGRKESKCQSAIAKAGRDLVLKSLAARGRCATRLLDGKTCDSSQKLSKLAAKARQQITKACAGADLDQLKPGGCGAKAGGAADTLGGCIVDGHGSTVAEIITEEFGDGVALRAPSVLEEPGSGVSAAAGTLGKQERKCQAVIAKAGRRLVQKSLQISQRCATRALRGKSCDTSGKTARLAAQARKQIARACGGADLGALGGASCAATAGDSTATLGDCIADGHGAAVKALIRDEFGVVSPPATLTVSGTVASSAPIRGPRGDATSMVSAGATADPFAPVDQVWAVPINGTSFDRRLLEQKQVLELAADGSFTFTVSNPSSYDYVFVLVNSANCSSTRQRNEWNEADIDHRKGCIVAYVTIPDAEANQSLMAIPTTRQTGDLDLGTLSAGAEEQNDGNDDEAMSDVPLEDTTGQFSVDLTGLKQIARADNLLKLVRYAYANWDAATGLGYDIQIGYKWNASVNLSALANAPIPGATTATNSYMGYNMYFYTNVDALDLVSMVQSQDGFIQLVPPAAVPTDREVTFTPAVPASSSTGGTFDGTTYVGPTFDAIKTGPDNNGIPTAFGGPHPFFLGVNPEGEWKFRRAGVVVSKYDLRLVSPFDLAAGTTGVDTNAPLVFIPAPTLNTTSGRVDSVTVHAQLFDGQAYEDVEDAVFYDSASMVYMSLNGTSSAGCPAGGVEFSNTSSGSAPAHEFSATSPTWTPVGSWTVGTGDATACRIDEMFLEYRLSGISFVFQWTNSGT